MIHQPSGGAQGVADMEINLREMLKLKDELYKSFRTTLDKHLTKCTKTQNVITG
jgi:ATP-dependent protease ClpP protease subunit